MSPAYTIHWGALVQSHLLKGGGGHHHRNARGTTLNLLGRKMLADLVHALVSCLNSTVHQLREGAV